VGLDIVEFVIATEKEFEIAFDDAELSRIRTVGEFHEIVLRELRLKQPHATGDPMPKTVCASSRAFYRLRKALIESGVARRKDVAPKAALESLIPRENRRAVWDEVAHLMRCKLPRLERTNVLCGALLTAAAFIALAPLAFGFIPLGTGAVWWLVLSGLGLLILFRKLSEPQALEFQAECQTVEGLVGWLTTTQRPRFAQSERAWTDREAWETICRLLVGMQGLKPEQTTPEATFVDDLGMD